MDITDKMVLGGVISAETMNNLTNNKRPLEGKDHTSSKNQRVTTFDLSLKSVRKMPFPRTFHEPFNVGTAQRLLASKLLREESDKDGIPSERVIMSRMMNKTNDTLPVTYKWSKHLSGYGRVYPQGNLSQSQLRKEVRATMLAENWVDFDMKNAQFEIAFQLCQDHGIPCQALGKNVRHRGDYIGPDGSVSAMFRDEVDPTTRRDIGKELFIAVFFGGNVETWLNKHGAMLKSREVPEIVAKMGQEGVAMSKTFQANNPAMVEAVRVSNRKKGKSPDKLNGTFLAIYLQTWERRCLQAMFGYLRDEGIISAKGPASNQCFLAHDGITVYCNDSLDDPESVARGMEAAIYEDVGLKMTIVNKPFGDSLLEKLEACESQALVIPPEIARQAWSKDFMDSLPDFAAKKAYFDRYCCKIRETSSFAFLLLGEEPRIVTYSKSDLVNAFQDVPSGTFAKGGRPISFISMWLADCRACMTMDFVPFNGTFNIEQHLSKSAKTNVYNRFTGYNPNVKSPLPEGAAVVSAEEFLQDYLRVGLHLCEGNEPYFEFFLDCLAFKVQFPKKKLPFSIVLIGPEGVGKTLFTNGLQNIFGKKHFYMTQKAGDVLGNHAEGMADKIVIVMNETSGADTNNWQGVIKSFITDEMLTINPKNVRPYEISNYAFIIITTNKSNPIRPDSAAGDRHFVVYKATDEFTDKGKYGTPFWSELAQKMDTPLFARCLYDFLNNRNVADKNWIMSREENLSETYRGLFERYVSQEALFILDLVAKIERREPIRIENDGGDDIGFFAGTGKPRTSPTFAERLTVKKGELYSLFKKFCATRNFRPVNAKVFKHALTEQFPRISTVTGLGGYPCFKFLPSKVQEHAKAKGWVRG